LGGENPYLEVFFRTRKISFSYQRKRFKVLEYARALRQAFVTGRSTPEFDTKSSFFQFLTSRP
jgi:hypothetical protein